MGRDNTIRGFPVHGAGVPFSGNRDTKGVAMTISNPVAQSDGVAEGPERVWFYRLHDGTWIPAWNRTAPSDIEYIRAPTPDSVAEKARRVVDTLSRGNWLLADATEDEVQQVVAIITTEFGAGGGDG
jgi:hypothetical protein